MFKQVNRLKKEQDVKAVVKKGKSVFDPVCGVKFLANNSEHSRFVVVVGVRVHKSAVKRNRVKRQYREIVKAHLHEIVPGMDVVLLTSKAALESDYQEKEERLMRVLKKAKLLV